MERVYPRQPWSVAEYLAAEEHSAERHEFVGGELRALSGGSRTHSEIAGNIFAALHRSSRDAGCRIHRADMRLRVSHGKRPEDGVFYYPDVFVVCGPAPGNTLYEEDAGFVVEVLSPSTEQLDRTEKRARYLRLPSLLDYLLVHQDRRQVTWIRRDGTEAAFEEVDLVGGGLLVVRCLGQAPLDLDAIYRGVLDVPE